MTDSVEADSDPWHPVVWLWRAGSHSGVRGRERDALDAAEEFIGIAGTATVEKARVAYDEDMLRVHERTGKGWTGTVRDGVVSWVPLERPPLRQAAA